MAGFAHDQVWRVRDLTGDPAALGGAVTVALCGHWEHDGDCRWPHHSSVEPDGDEHVVTVAFDASPAEVPLVRRRIREGLSTGRLTGPDGVGSTWRLLD
ncbi:hypothetical protein GCM10027080_02340 [Pedococcus soli]